MVYTMHKNSGLDLSIRLLRDRIGHRPWILALSCPDRDFVFALETRPNIL